MTKFYMEKSYVVRLIHGKQVNKGYTCVMV